MFLEEHARLLLVLHAVLGASTVAVSTHLVIWTRRWLRGQKSTRSVQRFANLSLALFALTFSIGNLAYPIYKVNVRAAYLDSAEAVAGEMSERAPDRAGAAVDQAARIARWFDVKEHWVAMGLVLALACALILRVWQPSDGAEVAPIVLGMALGAAATAWLAAIVGLVTSSVRAIGSLG